MKITNLSVKGYRSFKDVSWKPGDLNVVIGPNGSGKSNLLRLLELISAAATGQLSDYVLAAGGMEPLLWDGAASGIEIGIEAFPFEVRVEPKLRVVSYDLRLARVGKTTSYRVAFEHLEDHGVVGTLGPTPLAMFIYAERRGLEALLLDEHQQSVAAPEGSVRELETVLSQMSFPFTPNPWAGRFQLQLAHWRIYHDVRVDRDALVRQAALVRPEAYVSQDGQNLVSFLHTLYTSDLGFRDEVDMAMRAAFSDDYRELQFAPAADGRVQMRVRWRSLSRAVSSADLSDGTLRFLFLIAVLAHPDPPPLIAIDEPETGLHPSMLPIVAEYAVDAATRTQVIFTTHSPQFLDAFADTKPTTTVASWSDGESRLSTLPQEELAKWLREYSLGALFQSGELEGMAADLVPKS